MYGDGGFEAGIGIAVDPYNPSGYRVPFSRKYQCAALVRYPLGGYVRVANCRIEKDEPFVIEVVRRGRDIREAIDGQEVIQYREPLLLLPAASVGLLTSSGEAWSYPVWN